MEPMEDTVSFEDFTKVDIRVGEILEAAPIPRKNKLLALKVNVGEAEPRCIVSGLAKAFPIPNLLGCKVLVVVNLPERDFGGGYISRGMILAAGVGDNPGNELGSLALATVDGKAVPGTRVSLEKFKKMVDHRGSST